MMSSQMSNGAKYAYSELTISQQSHELDHMVSRSESRVREGSISSKRQRPHWYGPTSMVVFCIFGILLAITHHLYNTVWNGRPVESTTKQTWINRGGVVLAFLTTTCFAVTSATAYFQQQYLTMRAHPFLLPEMDILFGVLRDAKLFLRLDFWWSRPLLLVPAIVTWLGPIAAVFSAAPMSTVIRSEPNYTKAQVPQLYLNPQITASRDNNTGAITTTYPTSMHALTLQTAISDYYPSLPYPDNSTNATYEVTYTGPRLWCQDISSSPAAKAFQILNQDPDAGGFLYYSYVPSDPVWATLNATTIAKNDLNYWQELDQSPGPTALVVLMQGISPNNPSQFFGFKCGLWNATQKILFNFTYPFQSYDPLDDLHWSTAIGVSNLTGLEFHSQLYNDTLFSLATMQLFGYVFAGGTKLDKATNSTSSYHTSQTAISIDWYNVTTAMEYLEQLFFMTSIGYLSSDELTHMVSADVIIGNNVPVFHYQKASLLTAYGVLIGFSLVCVCIGLRAFYMNGASYTNRFSTTMRAFEGKMDRALSEPDNGADPLPEKLKKVEVFLGTQPGKHRESYS